MFADITAAGFDLLTWRKGPAPDVPAAEFTTITCADDHGRERHYDLADTTITLDVSDGPSKGQTVSCGRSPAGSPPTATRSGRSTRSPPGPISVPLRCADG